MEITKLARIIRDSSNIVFFGGAGVSTESSIPDFRSDAGLFIAANNRSYPPETILSHSFFVKYPADFFSFYTSKLIYPNAKPNPAHLALAKLEQDGKLKAVITQNIDGLHQMAGSANVIELHGSIQRNFCTKCKKFFAVEYILTHSNPIPLCDECTGIIKPDVVLYEEELNNTVVRQAINYITNADVLIVGGTSLVVYPAAGFLQYYKGTKLVLINKTATVYDQQADLLINESIGKLLSKAYL